MKKIYFMFLIMSVILTLKNVANNESIAFTVIKGKSNKKIKKLIKNSMRKAIHSIKKNAYIITLLLKKDVHNSSIDVYADEIVQSIQLVRDLHDQLDELSCSQNDEVSMII